ncbi:MAG: hypothetical protein AABY26_00075 [Nanoarchaeota archaeon]
MARTPLLPTLSFLIGSLFSNLAYAEPPKTIKLELGSAVTLSELAVNTGEQHYSFKRSQRDGEQDLYRRCLDSDLEEAWVFVRYSNMGEWWHEAGEDETEETASISPIGKLLTPPETIEEVYPYHFHRDKINGKGFASETFSLKDINGAIITAYIVKSVSPELLKKSGFKIVVASGIYTVKVDVKVLEDYAALKETIDATHSSKALEDYATLKGALDAVCSSKALKCYATLKEATDTANSMEYERWKITLGTSEFDYSPGNRVNFPRLNQVFAQRYSSGAVKIEFVPK